MNDNPVLEYKITDPFELNLSYMPFVNNGGLFIPSTESFSLGALVTVILELPGKKEKLKIEGRVVWITPKNALHHVLPGVGIQFVGSDAIVVRSHIESQLDSTIDVGGYTYGITEAIKKNID